MWTPSNPATYGTTQGAWISSAQPVDLSAVRVLSGERTLYNQEQYLVSLCKVLFRKMKIAGPANYRGSTITHFFCLSGGLVCVCVCVWVCVCWKYLLPGLCASVAAIDQLLMVAICTLAIATECLEPREF